MSKTTPQTRYVKFFVIAVIVLAIISIAFKAFILVRESSFVYGSYNMLLLDQNAYLIHVDREDKKTAVIRITGARSKLINHTRLAQSIILGVPLDGVIISKHKDAFSDINSNFMSKTSAVKLITNPAFYIYSNVNSVDLVKIFIYTKFTDPDSKSFETIASDEYFKLDPESTFIPEVFRDRKIFNEKLSIQIINSTDINGLGTKVSTMLKDLGCNVISVDTDTEQKSFIKAISSTSQTVSRIADLFPIPYIKSNSNVIADVTLILGSDIAKELE